MNGLLRSRSPGLYLDLAPISCRYPWWIWLLRDISQWNLQASNHLSLAVWKICLAAVLSRYSLWARHLWRIVDPQFTHQLWQPFRTTPSAHCNGTGGLAAHRRAHARWRSMDSSSYPGLTFSCWHPHSSFFLYLSAFSLAPAFSLGTKNSTRPGNYARWC